MISVILNIMVTNQLHGLSLTWKAYRSTASQKIPWIFMEPEDSFPYSQTNAVYAFPSNLLKNHINIILLSMARSWKWSLSLRFPHQNPSPLPHTCYIARPSHSFWFDNRSNIWWGVQIFKSLLCSLLHSPVTSYRLGPNIFFSTHFLNTLSLCLPLNLTDQLSHPYKTTCKIIVHYILICIFLDGKKEDKRFRAER